MGTGKRRLDGMMVAGVEPETMVGVPGWYLKAMGAEKRDFECWKGTGKRRLG